MLKLLISCVVLFLYACTTPKKQKETTNNQVKNEDTFLINKKIALLYAPDSLQIVKRKKEIGADNFYIGADDFLYYMQDARRILDSLKIPIQEIQKVRFLKFMQNNGSVQILKKDSLPVLWGILFFEPGKKPYQAEMTQILKEVKKYYHP